MRVEIEELSRSSCRTCALRDVQLDLPPGKIVALVGLNGAGKSTLLHCLAGTVAPGSGTIRYDGTLCIALGGGTWLILAMKILALVLAIQPLSIVPAFSGGTNDTSAGCLSQVFVVLGLLLAAIGVVPAVIVALVAETATVSATAIVVTAILSWLLGVGYGFLYVRNFFDHLVGR